MALEGIVPIIIFPDKATIWILALIYDEDKALADPTAVKVSITDPDGTLKVDGGSMTQYNSETGIYEYFYHKGESADPLDSGQWHGEILAIDGTGENAIISPKSFGFQVK